MSHLHFLALGNLFAQTDEHQGSEIHGDKPECNYRKDGGAKEGYHHPFQYFLYSIKYYQFYKNLIFQFFNISILFSLCLSSLDHLLACIHIHLNAAVLLATLGSRVVGYGIARTLTLDTLDLSRLHTAALKIIAYAGGTRYRERLVDGIATCVVGMT